MTRVQIPAYTDRWMMGDRYGEIVKTTKVKPLGFDKEWMQTKAASDGKVEVVHVKLDKSDKTVRVILADCEVV